MRVQWPNLITLNRKLKLINVDTVLLAKKESMKRNKETFILEKRAKLPFCP